MFRQIVTNNGDAELLFNCHPIDLARLVEFFWDRRTGDNVDLGLPNNKSNLSGFMGIELDDNPINRLLTKYLKQHGKTTWDHLIYAYMIENTKIYEIFHKVLFEFLHGERLGVADMNAQNWLRNTEALFYNDPLPFSVHGITSYIRKDINSIHRNAYWRMFGMDLTNNSNNTPYPYIKSDAYNSDFVSTFEEFLREMWLSISNVSNTSGPNQKDIGKIRDLVIKIRDMLVTRRINGTLSREEFEAVCKMSWLHLSVDYNTPIVNSLRANGSNSKERLFKIAQRVGVPAHGLADSFFRIADPISQLLILIEGTDDIQIGNLIAQFTATGTQINPFQTIVSEIITHWTVVTGHDMKAGKVVVK